MAARHSRHVALAEPLARFVDRQVPGGRYASASEVVRAPLRLLEQQEGSPGLLIDPDRGFGQAHGPTTKGRTGS